MASGASSTQRRLSRASPTAAALPARLFRALITGLLTLARILARISECAHRQRVKREIARMTGRELSNINVTRGEVGENFRPEFAKGRAVDRAEIAAVAPSGPTLTPDAHDQL